MIDPRPARMTFYGFHNLFVSIENRDGSNFELHINKEKVLKPVKYGSTKVERIEGGYFDDDTQAYGGAIFCSFDKKDINNEDFIELVLFEGTRKLTLTYEFDLKRIK